ncbi:MAG TPA: AgmX/PglI C-terminal domain-containing protein [Kofleriaceae bacterium]|nr:AgmX/PglI C-terminal domain-containing protein [Kofleriaceae bacterium]
MERFWAGLAVGALAGALATWLLMARPWRSADRPVVEAVADAAPDPAVVKKKPRRGRRGGAGGGAGEADTPPPVLSASDRERVWRGAAISLPTRSIDMGSDSSARPLESSEIDDTMRRSSHGITSCIESALAGAELAGGSVELEMLVSGAGAVQKVRVGAPRWLMDHGFADCASAAARRIRFPSTGAPTVVNTPFHLD